MDRKGGREMVTIGVMTDLHLGVRPYGLQERENDFYEAYRSAIDIFVNRDVSLVILGGDLFDQPRPSPRAMEVFIEGIIKLKSNGIMVLNIIGNHAMIQSPDFVTADELILTAMSSTNYCLLDKAHQYISDDVSVVGLPYYFNFELDTLIEDINKLNDEMVKNKSQSKILVLHQAFKEFCGFTGEKLSINDINVDNFDLVICGHIHERKLIDISNETVFLQPGSLERLTVAEARDEEVNGKGVYIIESEDLSLDAIARGFIPLKYKRQFLIADMYMDQKEDIEDIKAEILENVSDSSIAPILFLNVHDSSKSFQQLIDLTKDLKKDCLTVNFNYFDEGNKFDEDLEISEGDIPVPREVLRLALNPLGEDEARLGLDLYDLLKDGKDVDKLLDDFLKKRTKKSKKIQSKIDFDKEEKKIAEYIKYFEGL